MPNKVKNRDKFDDKIVNYGGFSTPIGKRKIEEIEQEIPAGQASSQESSTEEGTNQNDFSERASDRRITEESYRQSLILTNEVSFNPIINYEFIEELGASDYLIEIIAVIIESKKLKKISLPSPFGYFNLYRRSNKNYIARLRNFPLNVGTYEYMLLAISNFEYASLLIKEFRKFLDIKLDRKFYIDMSKPNIEFQLSENMYKYIQTACVINMNKKVKMPLTYGGKNYNITYSQICALMCGIFISEMIRTSGKIVRSAFKNGNWPRNYKELSEIFVQANKKGNELLRNYIQDPKSCPPYVRKAATRNVSFQSPFKKPKSEV